MFWQTDPEDQEIAAEAAIDAIFSISAKILPIDHSYLLSQAILQHLDWLDKVNAGIFDISVADGNGWEQDRQDGFYYPSKRSKLHIRLPQNRLKDAAKLVGKTLDLGQYQMTIVKSHPPKKLTPSNVLFAKHIISKPEINENDFLETVYQQLKSIDIAPIKIMPGLSKTIKAADATIHTRSLLIADLSKKESIKLQEFGIGKHHLLGCGLFIAHKDI